MSSTLRSLRDCLRGAGYAISHESVGKLLREVQRPLNEPHANEPLRSLTPCAPYPTLFASNSSPRSSPPLLAGLLDADSVIQGRVSEQAEGGPEQGATAGVEDVELARGKGG